MAMKSIILFITLLVVIFVAPQANAQSLFRINGTVYCSPGGAPLVNGATPPFANATVQAMIGPIPIGEAVITDTRGEFVIDFLQSLLGSLASKLQSMDAKVVVTTPLTACNSSFPANTFLVSVPPFQLLSNNTGGTVLLSVRSYDCVAISVGLL
uniref:uncharacterized protein LOC122596443 n=1 Tax=Erigeron canadensis TaxID=72917 RepID=UPI001CB9D56A|nr:uncharacterized protein LOC122596443 [Erigeron canadensis]